MLSSRSLCEYQSIHKLKLYHSKKITPWMTLIRHFVSQILKNLSLHFWHKKKKIHIFIGELHFKIDKKSPRFLHWHDTCYHDTMTSVCPKKCIKPKNNIPHRDLFWKNLTESIKRSQNFLHNFFFYMITLLIYIEMKI